MKLEKLEKERSDYKQMTDKLENKVSSDFNVHSTMPVHVHVAED